MTELVADRFVTEGASWIDLATGASVRLRIVAATGRSAQIAWADRCATLSTLRHPLLNVLVDFGNVDASRLFEAYAPIAPALASGHAGSSAASHLARFLESHGVPVTRGDAEFAVCPIGVGPSRAGRRPIGVVVQRRHLHHVVDELLCGNAGGELGSVAIAAPPGAGLRTMRTTIARMARMQGFVPVGGAALSGLPDLAAVLAGRHVCLLIEAGDRAGESRAAALLAGLGTVSARRHVLIRFYRTHERVPCSLPLEPMGVRAMTQMIFIDRVLGPSPGDVFSAARQSEGWPGRMLQRLRAGPFMFLPSTACVVHESSPQYFTPGQQDPAVRRSGSDAGRRTLVAAAERAARLAARGRHAAAVRLLTRGVHVLAARGEATLAAGCAEQLGWILRNRGRTTAALEHFERTRQLDPTGAIAIAAAVGIGVLRTDENRLLEAEAALRAAVAAAGLAQEASIAARATLALARCLYWQQRYPDASAVLSALSDCVDDAVLVDAWALAARIRIADHDPPGATAAATEALRRAPGQGDRALAVASRAMAEVQLALGNDEGAGTHATRGLHAATKSHLPLLALRIRALLARLSDDARQAEGRRAVAHVAGVLARGSVPPLLCAQLREARARHARVPIHAAHVQNGVCGLEDLLSAAHAAGDDRAAAEAVCRVLCDRLRAATVQIAAAPPTDRVLARAGRPWQGHESLIARVVAGNRGLLPDPDRQPRAAAEPIQYGRDTLAVLACRWPAGVCVEPSHVAGLLKAGALAAAACVRLLLDDVRAMPPATAWQDLLGCSDAAIALREAIGRAARAPFPVLVEGESGSGKELVARAIHRLGSRRERRLCAINCAALSDDLLEAELFGHARGAFTGAIGERAGLFEEADGGTLFLDEVGELSPRAQAKLLRVLQDGEVRRVGENFARRVDARVVAATNRRLEDEVHAGRFRADLRFRLDVVRIVVPPLRDRATDIPEMAAHFWQQAAARLGSRASLAPETVAVLTRYEWPGNIRELQNAIASLAVHAPRRGRISPSLLPVHIARASVSATATFEAAREEFERRFVLAALARAGGRRAGAARALGVTRQGLAKMLRRLRIES